ncbi:hypothetical protein N8590_03145 [bacterium]|jgi:hypothetical protein|nr:hypothetical protein [Planctomicrobium sp.]MDA7527962.1 hypothetical protein [bacterium]
MNSPDEQTLEDEDPWWQSHKDSMGVTLCSVGLHVAVLAILAMIVLPHKLYDSTEYMTIRTEVTTNAPLETVDNLEITPDKLVAGSFNDLASVAVSTNVVSDQPSATTIDTKQEELQWEVDAMEFLGQKHKFGELSGRTDEARSILLKAFGGSATSEAAVASGLVWLKLHQKENGSWSFNHTSKDCGNSCTSAGSLGNNRVGATAMALLCYIGAGHTHLKGNYQETVKKGLGFIEQEYLKAENKGDLRGVPFGNSGMYAQGLITIALCELYALTRDRHLRNMAQDSVDFIIAAQHPENGGWRYRPNQGDGDTSVVGWQIMALTSAKTAGLTVPGRVQVRAERFLESVQLEDGAYYGYIAPQKKSTTTAIGLLCRMYYGWDARKPAMQVGVKYLGALGPAKDNQYYNYYATQVMHHWGGQDWKNWNRVMREMLVSTQTQEGHAAGSWAPRDPHARTGGRHYATCLSILTLEVYYRHLPLYHRRMLKKEI